MTNSPQTLVELRNVKKTYHEGERQHAIFQNLNLSFARGESVALLGRSGSGKTTLLNLLSGIDLPDQGDVIVDGINLASLSEHQRTLFRRRNIGFVFQFFNLIPTLTVLENILLPLELIGGLNRDHRNRANQLLADVGLLSRADSFPDTLSGGEQQRVAIARAMVHRPKLLLADEPTGNLDAETSATILQLLRDALKQSDTTLIMVTHSHEIASIAQRVLVMKQGQLVANV